MVTPLDPLLTSKQTFRAPTQSIAQLSLVSEILKIPDIMGFVAPSAYRHRIARPLATYGLVMANVGGTPPRPRILNPWWIQRFSGFATRRSTTSGSMSLTGSARNKGATSRVEQVARPRRQHRHRAPRRVSPGSSRVGGVRSATEFANLS